ncbi:BZ3500_MvSof-1268-A1-R1_Chr5-3g08225 [Microbotryum saponariae]|uniref:BZ3500_MvSof-1268-A1-R1_Chr5-3g08225 protein n=1 Tax=Microbotryum saponariae TaxID=289078 RepID=A0A2X0KH42_9BASI|nr:BZ3500_MvSof-1268-A1-R1_Chr5-3g08225 [Microbotryum saponariae]SDA07984.1 BZ3501_MvSof-1269-A2-R1_Chr5-1g07369 [Microbotryum saponariae]
MSSKRAGDESSSLIKRVRMDQDGTAEDDPAMQQIVVASDGNSANKGALIQTIRRTSGLQAPIMCLQVRTRPLFAGHQGEILDVKFSPDGEHLASSGVDRIILLWNVYGECRNWGMLRTPKGAPTSIAFVGNDRLLAGSTDHTLFLFHLPTGEVQRRFRGHTSIVNSVDVQRGGAGRDLFASGSDDGYVMVWSEDSKDAIEVVELGYPVTAVKWSEDGQQLFIGGLDNDVHVYSLASKSVIYSLRAHTDTITSLCLSPSNPSHLLSTGMDSVLHLWSVAPFAPTINASNPSLHPRLIRSFYGAPAGFEGLLRRASFSRHSTQQGNGGSMVAVGGADRALTIWDAETASIRYKLPGHTGTVIATDWSPKEPICASTGVEGVIYLGEVASV